MSMIRNDVFYMSCLGTKCVGWNDGDYALGVIKRALGVIEGII